MTEARTTRRRRRATNPAHDIPQAVAAWFGGQARAVPWEALLHAEVELVPDWWRQWADEHPGAIAPNDASWIRWGAA